MVAVANGCPMVGRNGHRPLPGSSACLVVGPAAPRQCVSGGEPLAALLEHISPEKRALRARTPAALGYLELRSWLPFGPGPADVAAFLLGERATAAWGTFRDRFGLELVVTGGSAALGLFPHARVDRLPRAIPPAAALDICEFCLLAQAAEGSYADGCLVSCLLAPTGAVVTVQVPSGAPLAETLAATEDVRRVLAAEGPGVRLWDALTGVEVPASDRAARRLRALVMAPVPYRPRAANSFLFPFPFFRRRLEMQPVALADPGGPLTPCCNCLACAEWCPARVRPSHLYHHLRRGERADAEALGLMTCVGCGWCTTVCPSGLPLAQTLAAGQDAVRAEEAP